MAIFSCNGCGSDDSYYHLSNLCADCAYYRDLIDDDDYDALLER